MANEPTKTPNELTANNISTITQDPVIETRRRINHFEAMRHNTNNLRHGKYSKYHPAPNFLTEYMTFIDELSLKSPEEIGSTILKLIKSNLKRMAWLEYREMQGDDSVTSELSKLSKITFVQLDYLRQNPEITSLVPEQISFDLSGLDDEDLKALEMFGEGLAMLSGKLHALPS